VLPANTASPQILSPVNSQLPHLVKHFPTRTTPHDKSRKPTHFTTPSTIPTKRSNPTFDEEAATNMQPAKCLTCPLFPKLWGYSIVVVYVFWWIWFWYLFGIDCWLCGGIMEVGGFDMERFWREWGEVVDRVADAVVRSSSDIVPSICRILAMDREDLLAECRLAVLRHAEWLDRKQWLDRGRNVEGYFYRLMRNRLIDLYKRCECRLRAGIEFNDGLFAVSADLEDGGGGSGGGVVVVQDEAFDLVYRNEFLLSVLELLVDRVEYLERRLRSLGSVSDWSDYVEWWTDRVERSGLGGGVR
jgi:DNA-directed RNA polymerase specialized sigma24 family protein